MATVVYTDMNVIAILVFLITIVKSSALTIYVPSYVTVFETNTVELLCKVRSMSDGQRIVWYRDNIRIDPDNKQDRYKIQEATYKDNAQNYDLEISNVSRNDKNTKYTCRVMNGNDEVGRSIEASLDITNVPVPTHPYFYPICQKITAGVTVGEQYRVSCETEYTEPPVQLILRKGNQVLCNRTVTEEDEACSYTIDVKLQDADTQFTCSQIGPNVQDYPPSVTNICTIGKLNILQPPTVDIKGDTSATKGREVVLICDPEDAKSCKWKFENNNYIKASQDNTGNACILRLTLSESSTLPSLNITCIAMNAIGRSSSTKTIYFDDSKTTGLPVVDWTVNPSVRSPLWTGVIIAITGCFAIVIVLITSVILYCGWRHFLPVYSHTGVPSQDIYSEQYNRSPYRMESVQKCIGIQVSDEASECTDDVEKKLTIEPTKRDEQHYSHICSP